VNRSELMNPLTKSRGSLGEQSPQLSPRIERSSQAEIIAKVIDNQRKSGLGSVTLRKSGADQESLLNKTRTSQLQSVSNVKKSGDDDRSIALSKLSSRASNLAKAVRQATREEQQEKFTPERQKKFINYLLKLNWKFETTGAQVTDAVYDDLFNLLENALQSDELAEVVVPTLNILT